MNQLGYVVDEEMHEAQSAVLNALTSQRENLTEELQRINSIKQHIKVSIKNEIDAAIIMLDGLKDERTPSLLK